MAAQDLEFGDRPPHSGPYFCAATRTPESPPGGDDCFLDRMSCTDLIQHQLDEYGLTGRAECAAQDRVYCFQEMYWGQREELCFSTSAACEERRTQNARDERVETITPTCEERSSSSAAASGSPAESTATGPGAETSSPAAVTRAWSAAVVAGDWELCASLYAPEVRAAVLAEIRAATPAQWAQLEEVARRIEQALAQGEPEFIEVPAVLAEPLHQEWYYCGERPAGEVWRSPCSVAVIEADGRWYIADVD